MASGVGGLLGAGVGALIGSMPDTASSEAKQGVHLNEMDEYGKLGQRLSQDNLSQLTNLSNSGPGQSDVERATASGRSFADLLSSYSQSGGLPTDGDINSSMDIAKKMFNPQQTSLNQSMVLQNQQANQMAARLGRSVDDPILQAKMRTQFMNQQGMLDANTGAYGQQLAMSLPGQRVAYAGQANNVLSGLATQAFQNRAALMSMGNQIFNQQQNFQLGSSERYGNQSMSVGGGLKGALEGAITGFSGGQQSGQTMFGGSGGGGMGAQAGAAPSGFNQTGPWAGNYGAGGPSGAAGVQSMGAAAPQMGPWAGGYGTGVAGVLI